MPRPVNCSQMITSTSCENILQEKTSGLSPPAFNLSAVARWASAVRPELQGFSVYRCDYYSHEIEGRQARSGTPYRMVALQRASNGGSRQSPMMSLMPGITRRNLSPKLASISRNKRIAADVCDGCCSRLTHHDLQLTPQQLNHRFDAFLTE